MAVTRIKTSDGKFCYSGPNCKWHSANGISAARRELRNAERDLANANSFEELVAAKERQQEAIKVYDTTTEGLENLKTQVREASGEDKKYLEARLAEATAQAAVIEAEAQAEWEQAGDPVEQSIALSDNHTYKVPTFEVVGDDIYAPTVGSKYTGYRPAAEIAKDVRNDLKEAQKAGYLPKHLTFSVTRDYYSGGQAVRVTVKGVEDSQQFSGENLGGRFGNLTPEAVELRKRVDGIASAYNSSCIRGEIDYFNTMYYATVDVETDHDRNWRTKEAAVAKEKRAVSGLKKELITKYKGINRDTFVKENNVSMANATKDGVKFGRVEGTSFVAFEFPSRMNPGQVNTQVFDFTGVEPRGGASLEEFISSNEGKAVANRYSRNRFI